MLELTGLGELFRALGVVYWLVALGAVWAALALPRSRKAKAIVTSGVVVLFGIAPTISWLHARERAAYAAEAWAHFKKLCSEKAGEKIYKTHSGVRSVLVVKPLPPATEKDLYDQFWMGDPYSASANSDRGAGAAVRMTLDSRMGERVQRGLEFVEIGPSDSSGQKLRRIYKPASNLERARTEFVDSPLSRFGVSWNDVSTPEDRKYWVAASRLVVVDLVDNSLVAERVGYFIEAGFGSRAGQRRPWLTSRGPDTTCPSVSDGNYSDTWFITRVFPQDVEVPIQ